MNKIISAAIPATLSIGLFSLAMNLYVDIVDKCPKCAATTAGIFGFMALSFAVLTFEILWQKRKNL